MKKVLTTIGIRTAETNRYKIVCTFIAMHVDDYTAYIAFVRWCV